MGTRTTTVGVARSAVGCHLACTQGRLGSGVETMGRSEGVTGRARHRGEARRVGTRTATVGVARSAVGCHLACTQGHPGSGVETMGRSEGATGRASYVGAAIGVLSHRSSKVQHREAGMGRG